VLADEKAITAIGFLRRARALPAGTHAPAGRSRFSRLSRWWEVCSAGRSG
jgi:hypothetical protein